MRLINKSFFFIVLVWFMTCGSGAANSQLTMPSFLPETYRSFFILQGASSWTNLKPPTDEQAQFTNQDNETLTIRYFPSTRATEERTLTNRFTAHFPQNEASPAKILDITPRSFQIRKTLQDGSMQIISAYTTPDCLLEWQYQLPQKQPQKISAFLNALKSAAGAHRYQEALSQGNVALGNWSDTIFDHARTLSETKPRQALKIYQNLLPRAPSNYTAHFHYMNLADDPEAQKISARIVFNNAEDREQIDQAARLLGKPVLSLNEFPALPENPSGLQLILIPLDGCNPWVIKKAAALYQKMTDIPVNIQKPSFDFRFGKPDRFPRQRVVEKIAAGLFPTVNDFQDWSLDDFRARMRAKARAEKSPFLIYKVEELFRQIEAAREKGQGQWDAGGYVIRLQESLLPYQSPDPQTMFVAVTERDIFSGDTNFVFSLHDRWNRRGTLYQASLLSYARMRGEPNGEPPSQQRLAERIAKELVPASLKSLNIPRSADPTCPYSYANGIQRLDQKTLTLSTPVKRAIRDLTE
jgi:predicted Zn-dependent protease